MINLLNKSVKNLSSGITHLVNNFTSENSKNNIDLCLIESMNLNLLRCEKAEEMEKLNSNKETQVVIILHSNFYLNLYYLDDNLELKCFFTNKFLFPINLIENFSLGLNKTYTKELPLIALVSNSIVKNNQVQFSKNDYLLKIYSIKNKRVIHTLRFKKQIINFVSKINHFAISFSDFCIKIFENDKMTNIFTIKPEHNFTIPVSPKSEYESNQVNEVVSNCKFFDISDNFIVYYNDLDKLQFFCKVTENISNSTDLKTMSPNIKNYTIGSVTMDAFYGKNNIILGLNKLKDWSINQVKDFANLKKAYSLKNNSELESSQNGCFLNFHNITDISGHEIKKIFVPFFNDGISIIKFFHAYKYFIVGNKNSQIFYIYELYPSTNLKKNKNAEYHHRILYSLYRGMTNASINNIEWSSCKNFITISSQKGTVHVYYLPKVKSQIFDNHSEFNYKGFQEIYLNVTQATKIDKIRLGNFFNSNILFKSFSKIINNYKIEVESLPAEIKEILVLPKSERYVNYPVLLCLCDCESTLNSYILLKDKIITSKELIHKNEVNPMKVKEVLVSSHSVYHIKKTAYSLNINNSKVEVEPHFLEILKKSKILDSSYSFKKVKKLKEQIEIDTSEKNYAPMQINPLFTFNTYKPKKLEITSQYKIHKKSIDNFNNSGSNENLKNLKKSHTNLFQVNHKYENNNNESFSHYDNQMFIQRNSITNNNNFITTKRISIYNKNENETSQETVKENQCHKITNLKKKSINNLGSNNFSNQIHNRSNFTSYFLMKGKSNLMRMRTYSNYEEIENPYNSSINDIIVSEKLLCQELEYQSKQFKNEKRLNALKSESIYENIIYQPKLIIQPNLFFGNNRLPYPQLNSSISDKSSSKDNSLCTINQNIDLTTNHSTQQINNSIRSLNQNNPEGDSTNCNHNSFYKNRENFLENQIKLAMETNIIENFKSNEAQVKIYNEYNIDDNYLAK